MMRKLPATVEMSCRRSWPESVGWRRYGAMAALEAEAQAAAEQAEAEGGKHPGVPDDKAQRNLTDTESACPAPGGKDFLQAYNCQAVVDRAHQVTWRRGPPTRLRISNRLRPRRPSTTSAQPQGSIRRCWYYSAKAVHALCSGRGPVRRAGADPPRPGCATRAPMVAYPAICPQGPDATEADRPSGVGNAALRMQRIRYSARSSRGGDSGSSCCGGGHRRPQPMGICTRRLHGRFRSARGHGLRGQTVPLWVPMRAQAKHGSMGQPNASGTLPRYRQRRVVVSTALFAKLSVPGRPGQPAQLVVAIHCR